jgi:hypothetical protein
MSDTSLFDLTHVQGLVEKDDILDGIVECYKRIWSAPNALEQRHLGANEYNSRVLEQFMSNQYPGLYSDVLGRVEPENHALQTTEANCRVIADSLSLREAFQLCRDWEDESWDVSFDWTVVPAVPTATEFACRAWFNRHAPSAVSADDFTYLGGNEVTLTNSSPEYIWMMYADNRLHHSTHGTSTIEEVSDIYETTKGLLETIFSRTVHDTVFISSDHGYLNFLGNTPYSLSESAEQRVQNYFDDRYCEVSNDSGLHELEEQGVTVRKDGHYLLKGHYERSSRSRRFTHGGASLLECLTPALTVSL